MSYDLALLNKKPIFVDISISNCKPCKKIHNLYKKEKLSKFINHNFSAISITADKEKVPKELKKYFFGIAPTLFIIKNKKVTYIPINKTKSENEFLSYLEKNR
jgi:thiol-disulfide isomerase/thioredoxin